MAPLSTAIRIAGKKILVDHAATTVAARSDLNLAAQLAIAPATLYRKLAAYGATGD